MKLSKTFIIQKPLSFTDFLLSSIQLDTILSNYLVVGVDIKINSPFNNEAKISLGTFLEKEKFLNLSSVNLQLETRYILHIIKKVINSESIYLHLEGNPTLGEGYIYIYYITPSLYKEKHFTYGDFHLGKIEVGEISQLSRGFNVYVENISPFNEGSISVGKEGDINLLTPELDLSIPNNYLIPTSSEVLSGEEINIYFQGNPTQGEGNLIFYYFNR